MASTTVPITRGSRLSCPSRSRGWTCRLETPRAATARASRARWRGLIGTAGYTSAGRAPLRQHCNTAASLPPPANQGPEFQLVSSFDALGDEGNAESRAVAPSAARIATATRTVASPVTRRCECAAHGHECPGALGPRVISGGGQAPASSSAGAPPSSATSSASSAPSVPVTNTRHRPPRPAPAPAAPGSRPRRGSAP